MEFDSLESISTWSVYQVAHFVSQLVGTEIYSKILKENNVNGKVLLNCNLEGWHRFGIHTLAHRATLYGWAQGRIHENQERVSMRRRISGESTNQACTKELEKPNMLVALDNRFAKGESTLKKMPAKAILKESYASQSRVCNDNMKDMREWFKDGAGRFSRHEFLTGNLKKNKELKAAIIEVIEEKKHELTPVTIEGECCTWSTEEIFTKVMTHRNYMKKPKLEAQGLQSYAHNESSNSHALNARVKEVESVPTEEHVYIPFMGDIEQVDFHDKAKTFGEGKCSNVSTTTKLKNTFLSVAMFGSPFFIPEQVIQFRQDRLVARKAVLEYRYFQEFDEGMVGFGSGNLVQQDYAGPYERWEVEVADLAIGIGMKSLLLPGTKRAASTVRIGERLLLRAVYLLMTETVPNSESNHAKDNQLDVASIEQGDITNGSNFDYFVSERNSEECDAFIRQEHTSTYNNQEDLEASENIRLDDNNTTTMGLAARTTTNNDNAENAKVQATDNLTMECSDGRTGTLVEKLVCEYRSIDMDSALARQAILCTKEAFRQNEILAEIDGKSQESKTFETFDSQDLDIVDENNQDILVQSKGGKEASENIMLKTKNTTIMGPLAATITNGNNAENAKARAAENLTMGCSNGTTGALVEKLVCKYRSIDIESAHTRQETLCSEKALRQNKNATIDGKSQEAKDCTEDACMGKEMNNKFVLPLNLELVSSGAKKYMSINTCERSMGKNTNTEMEMEENLNLSLSSKLVQNDLKEANMNACKATSKKRAHMNKCEKTIKKKALKEITNDLLESSKKDASKNIRESHIPVRGHRHERPIKVPLRYKN